MQEIPTAFCLRSTQSEMRFFCWVTARRTRNGTSKQYQRLTRFSTSTWPASSARKKRKRRRNDMARNFRELQEKMSPESRARSEARAQAMLKELPLSELREAQHLTQAELAKRLNIGQDAVSKLEHRADMYLSTLSDFIRAAGGTLELTARFPSGDVHLICLQGKSSQPGKAKSQSAQKRKSHLTH